MARRQRMYHLVMYNISPIQQGIQAGHAVNEYALKYPYSKPYRRWAKKDKVVIILNGGTSNTKGKDVWGNECIGSMETHRKALKDNGVKHAKFHEPDLNNAMSAIAFLVDERVWDKEAYPDPVIQSFTSLQDPNELFEQKLIDLYGPKIAFLRVWLKQFRLA